MSNSGERWEKKVGSIFSNIGFSLVTQPEKIGKLSSGEFCYGKINPQFQPDIVVRVDRKRWILIECRDRRSATIRNWLQEIKGRTVQLCSQLKNETKVRETEVFGVAATSVGSLDSKVFEAAEEVEVSLWNHGFVEYLNAVSKGAGAQVKELVLFRSGIRQSTYPPIKISVQRWSENTKWFIGFVSPSQIARAAFVYHRGPGCDDMAYQRLLRPGRIQEIASFVKRGNVFPNSIVMAVPAGTKCPARNSNGGLVSVTIPGDPEGIKIIDGQHRFFGALASGSDPRLLITFVEADELSQAIMFATVNGKQVSVKKGELVALFGIPNFAAQIAAGVSDKDRERIELEHAVYRALERLDNRSPLKDRLNFYPGRPGQEMIPFKFIYDNLMRIARIEQSGFSALKGTAEQIGKEFGTHLSDYLDGWQKLIGNKSFYDTNIWFQPTMLSALLLTYADCRLESHPDGAHQFLERKKRNWKTWRPRPESYRGAAGATILARELCKRLGFRSKFI